jgi:hypothetical protein
MVLRLIKGKQESRGPNGKREFQEGGTQMSTNTQKLRVLRSRTDHDLLVIVNRELDRGLAMVEAAASRNSPLFTKAEKAFSTATALVPRIVGLGEGDRLRIEKTVKELWSRLAQVPQYANVRPYPASVAS